MPRNPSPPTSPRKQPVQARSKALVDAIVVAAIRVLKKDGPQQFTTIRVAQEAGVSVGSLYQYFPNKQAILTRLQLDEWKQTGELLDSILADTRRPPALRLRDTIRAFFITECEEAPLRLALAGAAPIYRDSAQSKAQRERGRAVVDAFVTSAAPRASPSQRRFATELMFETMAALGQQLSERRPAPATVQRWADASAEMLMAYLAQLRA
ncbi:MAG: TetR family transcriptional regulator [Myxococcaceae bacterium]